MKKYLTIIAALAAFALMCQCNNEKRLHNIRSGPTEAEFMAYESVRDSLR
jgi:hypothetical protein